MTIYVARVSCGQTNRNSIFVIDQARRLCDQLGQPGFIAKKRQTNARYVRRGSLSFAFPSRRLRERYIALLNAWGDPALVIERFARR